MNKKISLASSSRRFDKKWSSYDYLGLLLIVLWHVLCPGLGDNLHIVGRKYLSQQELLFIQLRTHWTRNRIQAITYHYSIWK